MKVLIVCRAKGSTISPFVYEQVRATESMGVTMEVLALTRQRGLFVSDAYAIRKQVQKSKPDIVHAHYGLLGLSALLAFTGLPLVTTFHGSDVNAINSSDISRPSLNRFLSRIAHRLSSFSIFVNATFIQNLGASNHYEVIPCHVDSEIFKPLECAHKQCVNTPYNVLFSSRFGSVVKNDALAKKAIVDIANCQLIELTGYTRYQVCELLNTSHLALLTSLNEGSPQFIKEAMACNCPIVSTDVGDVRWVMDDTEGCYICSFDPSDVATKIQLALEFAKTKGRTNGRQRIMALGLDSDSIARRVVEVYEKVMRK